MSRRQKLIHRAWDWKRTRYISSLRERVFADEWEKEAQPNPGLNFGFGALQDLLIDRSPGDPRFARRFVAEIGPRDAMIVATIMQWLGTNVGWCWLEQTLKKAGYRVVKERESTFSDCARVRIGLTGANRAIIKHFKKTFMMEIVGKMPGEVGISPADFRRAFKYLTDVGLCETLQRGPKGEKYASMTDVGIDLIRFAHFGSDKDDVLKLEANMPLRWLESTKLPFEFAESTEAKPEPVSKVSREERIEAIKAAQQERINARKFGELQSV